MFDRALKKPLALVLAIDNWSFLVSVKVWWYSTAVQYEDKRNLFGIFKQPIKSFIFVMALLLTSKFYVAFFRISYHRKFRLDIT